jgi:DNA helicase-2/ATP-dependent DNA helicase PcrA
MKATPSLILGPPGSGKTTTLLDIAEREMSEGVPSTDIAFVTFTRAGSREASARAARRFGLDAEKDLPWYRTLHSLAYQRLGIARDEVMAPEDWAKFALLVGVELTGHYDVEQPLVSGSERSAGDMMLRIVDFASTTRMTLEDAWHRLGEPIGWYPLRRFAETLREFKKDTGKLDFTDMLLQYVEGGKPVPVRVAIIDEAQDLTRLQWEVVRRAFAEAERVYIAGDDDQAIYHWAGADVETFLQLSETPRVLSQSYRLPRKIWTLAQSISGSIKHRYAKPYAPQDREGSIEWHMRPDLVDIKDVTGSWLLLARHNYLLAPLEALARSMGMNYRRREQNAVKPDDLTAMVLWENIRGGKLKELTAQQVRTVSKALGFARPALKELQRYAVPAEWPTTKIWHDALLGIPHERRMYYLAARRRGEKLMAPPRVRIETIHGAKGAEADHVLLMTDVSERTWRGFHADPDPEHRVFYVAATRARESLHLIRPQTGLSYPLL